MNYYGNDAENYVNSLIHKSHKYIKREKRNGKWRYWYKDTNRKNYGTDRGDGYNEKSGYYDDVIDYYDDFSFGYFNKDRKDGKLEWEAVKTVERYKTVVNKGKQWFDSVDVKVNYDTGDYTMIRNRDTGEKEITTHDPRKTTYRTETTYVTKGYISQAIDKAKEFVSNLFSKKEKYKVTFHEPELGEGHAVRISKSK